MVLCRDFSIMRHYNTLYIFYTNYIIRISRRYNGKTQIQEQCQIKSELIPVI